MRRVRLAWLVTSLLGVTVAVWIPVEVALFCALGFTPQYPLVGGIGAATIVLSLLPAMRRYYSPH